MRVRVRVMVSELGLVSFFCGLRSEKKVSVGGVVWVSIEYSSSKG